MLKRIWTALLSLALSAGTASAQFCPGASPFVFADVMASDPFCGYITWLAQNNVTLGCQVIDANNRLFCPADGVRRDQMAAFMSRLGEALFPSTCAAGQVMKWNGLDWTCADDSIGGGGGGGTVTNVAAGTGLAASPNPIVGAGTINVAASYRLPQGCAANQVPKWIGGAWACAADADTNSGGTVTSVTAGTGLTGGTIAGSGTIAADTNYLQRRVSASCAAGSSIRAIAADGSVTCETDDAGPANAFVQGGNSFGVAAVFGTNDGQDVEIRADGVRVMRFHPNAISPNVLGGNPANSITTGVRGATIAGGGVVAGDTDPDFTDEAPNTVTDHYGTVSGGFGNQAGDGAGTTADEAFATVGGGRVNRASGLYSTVGGGVHNTASGMSSMVGGGAGNTASGRHSTVAGGYSNDASGWSSTVGGGFDNVASGSYSTVGGGQDNSAIGDHSFAAGRRAKANHRGAFVWADSSPHDFTSGVENRFYVRATGGVRLVTAIDAVGANMESFFISPSGDVTSSGEINAVAFNPTSDVYAKTAFAPIDAQAILREVVRLPVRTWSFRKGEAGVRHIGPTAQDFRAAFGVGGDDRKIATVDADGVALAAIQGLNEKLEATIAAQARAIDAQRAEIAELRQAVERLLAR